MNSISWSQEWSNERASELSEPDRNHVLERLAPARAFLGSQDPHDFFRGCKTPEERYTPQYAAKESID